MALTFTTSYLEDARAVFHQYKRLAEAAVAQISDEQLYATLDAEMNSIAVMMKHMAGNMRSRWTDFLTSDGEKPDRNRETEFEAPPSTRAALLDMWETGWSRVFAALEPLHEEQLASIVTIRGERHAVIQAVNRQVAHYAYHVGQIVFLAKHWVGPQWRSLSIPRGKSAQFNRDVAGGRVSQR